MTGPVCSSAFGRSTTFIQPFPKIGAEPLFAAARSIYPLCSYHFNYRSRLAARYTLACFRMITKPP